MRAAAFFIAAMFTIGLHAQEKKPVPKDSVRIAIPGCTKGYVFTAGPRDTDEGSAPVPEGTHLRMNGPKALMKEIKEQEGKRIEITGLIKRGQTLDGGVGIGGARVTGAPPPGGMRADVGGGLLMIDVEGWRHVLGACPR